MKYYVKRIFSLLLVLCLLFGTIAAPGFADPSENDTVPAAAQENSEPAADSQDEASAPDAEEASDPVEETAEPEPEPEPVEEEIPDPTEPVSKNHDIRNDVPLLLQTDYPNVKYGSGSVATSGCSMAMVAMVATYLTGVPIYPDELAIRFRNDDASNLQRMEAASIVLDLKYKKTFAWCDVIDALKQGNLVTILVDKRSPFTKSQHFLLLTGISSTGKIFLNDSYGPNYKKESLKDGFENGFDQDTVYSGFSGAWIYSPYTPPEPTETRYPTIELTQEERDLIAKVVWLEARGESFEGQRAVAEVVFNRMVSDLFPTDTVTGTIMAEGQFRTSGLIDTARPGELQYKAVDKALSGPNILPMDVFFFARTQTNPNRWGKIGRHVFCKAY